MIKYELFINKLFEDCPENMIISENNMNYILIDRLALSLNQNSMTWLFKVFLETKYNILQEDNLTEYIIKKYISYNLDIINLNGNLFLSKDLVYVILSEFDLNSQLEIDGDNIILK